MSVLFGILIGVVGFLVYNKYKKDFVDYEEVESSNKKSVSDLPESPDQGSKNNI